MNLPSTGGPAETSGLPKDNSLSHDAFPALSVQYALPCIQGSKARRAGFAAAKHEPLDVEFGDKLHCSGQAFQDRGAQSSPSGRSAIVAPLVL